MLRVFCFLVLVAAAALLSSARAATDRYVVLVSDLHFGIGRSGGDWDPYEDFRWPKALEGFLNRISADGNKKVDLVIVGDFLELWQRPKDLECKGTKDAGCTEAEVSKLVARIVSAHADALQSLRSFAADGDNHLYVVPGNHDAALLLPSVWKQIADKLGEGEGRATLVARGLWVSQDKLVIAEHGHQIGSDVNRFADWPVVAVDGVLQRPWGELLVQSIFNKEEQRYPVIDNIIPESAGVKFRIADRGVVKSAGDVARFLAFNVLQTSFAQKMQALSADGGQSDSRPFDPAQAIANSDQLLLATLEPDDPMRPLLETNDPRASEIRQQWKSTLQGLPKEDVQAICDAARVVSNSNPCGTSLSAAAQAAAAKLLPKDTFMKAHLAKRRDEFGDFSVFVSGHTHEAEVERLVGLPSGGAVIVVNTGAFQRLTTKGGFEKRATEHHWSKVAALRKMRPEHLAPCYGAVIIEPADTPEPHLLMWKMEETSVGQWYSPGSSECE